MLAVVRHLAMLRRGQQTAVRLWTMIIAWVQLPQQHARLNWLHGAVADKRWGAE